MALLHDSCEHDLCVSQARAACRAPLSQMGISGGAGAVYRRCSGGALLHLYRQSQELLCRDAGDPGRSAGVLVVRKAEELSLRAEAGFYVRTKENISSFEL